MQNEEILLALGRLEGKVDALIKSTNLQTDVLKEHDSRIRVLETSKATIIGVCSVVAFVVSSVISTFIP